AMRTLRELPNPPACNLGATIRAAAGAGIAEHYHPHIVPRRPGDANLMTSVGGTRLIPDTPDDTHQQLRASWTRLYEYPPQAAQPEGKTKYAQRDTLKSFIFFVRFVALWFIKHISDVESRGEVWQTMTNSRRTR